MSSVQDCVNCPQCGYWGADYLLQCDTRDTDTWCRRCGYCEKVRHKYNEDGDILGWEHEVHSPAGTLWYRSAETGIGCSQPLPTKAALLEAEQWLREAVDKGQVDRLAYYVTRWNREAQQVEVIVGKCPEPPEGNCGESEDQIVPPQVSSRPMKPNTDNDFFFPLPRLD